MKSLKSLKPLLSWAVTSIAETPRYCRPELFGACQVRSLHRYVAF